MRRVLDGCMYDTATSERLACVASADNMPADEAWREILCRKRNGQYWLFCEGGKSTVYRALNRCNVFAGSWCIKVLSEDDARVWCEDNLDGDAYEAIWGPVSEDMPEAPGDPHYPLPGDPDYDPEQYMI